MQILHGHKAVVRVLAFSAEGTLLASRGQDETIRLWQFPEGVEWDRLEAPPYMPPCLAFSPDGRWLAAPVSGEVAAWVWDVSNPSERRELPLSRGGANVFQSGDAVTFSPDGRRLVLSGERGVGAFPWRQGRAEAMARSWQVGSWRELPARDFAAPCDGAWRRPWVLSPDGTVLATPDWKSVVFWDMASGEELFRLDGGKSVGYPGGLAFSPDGRRFAIARTRTIMTCDVAGRRPLATWKNPTTKYVQSLAFSPDGRTLATVSKDTTARLWDAATGRETAAYAWDVGPLNAVAFSADGMRAAVSGKKGTILVWDLD